MRRVYESARYSTDDKIENQKLMMFYNMIHYFSEKNDDEKVMSLIEKIKQKTGITDKIIYPAKVADSDKILILVFDEEPDNKVHRVFMDKELNSCYIEIED